MAPIFCAETFNTEAFRVREPVNNLGAEESPGREKLSLGSALSGDLERIYKMQMLLVQNCFRNQLKQTIKEKCTKKTTKLPGVIIRIARTGATQSAGDALPQ